MKHQRSFRSVHFGLSRLMDTLLFDSKTGCRRACIRDVGERPIRKYVNAIGRRADVSWTPRDYRVETTTCRHLVRLSVVRPKLAAITDAPGTLTIHTIASDLNANLL